LLFFFLLKKRKKKDRIAGLHLQRYISPKPLRSRNLSVGLALAELLQSELAAEKERRNTKTIRNVIRLLASFSPSDWSEDISVRAPPFTQENLGDRLRLIPRKFETEQVLDELCPALRLKKIVGKVSQYLATRTETIYALRMFNWFVRRSWRDKEFLVFWGAIRTGNVNSTSDEISVSVESIANLTGCDSTLSLKIMQKLVACNVSAQSPETTEYVIDQEAMIVALQRLLRKIRNRKEDLVMDTLCRATGASVAEICTRLAEQGLGAGTVYKAVEKLKREGYLNALRHVRVNKKGPMREFLSPNCRNCFYGYSDEASCLQDAFRELQDLLERYPHQRMLTDEDRVALFGIINSAPDRIAVVKKLLESVRLINQARSIINDERLLAILMRLRKRGVELLPRTISTVLDGEATKICV
jgi:hypothetical protein